MNDAPQLSVPAGFWQDAQGRMVPESLIKPIDIERDRLVRHLVDRASELSAKLADFKNKAKKGWAVLGFSTTEIMKIEAAL